MQLINVRVYGLSPCDNILPSDSSTKPLFPGESEYWFAMIKVLMIIVFIIVGLIYDWGGVVGHPGPVRIKSTSPGSFRVSRLRGYV